MRYIRKPPVYATISGLLFLFKQRSPLIKLIKFKTKLHFVTLPLVRVTGLEPAHLAAQEPKGNVTILEIYIRYYRQHSIVYKKLLNIL